MNIELRHLRYFVAVAEELHFGRAAARLNISQPPLSQQIQILEQQTGARLFARTNRSVSLTAAGKQFLADSRQILAQVDEAAARAARLHHGETGELRIGFTSSAPFIKAVSDTLSMFRQRLPDVHILTRETNTREQIVPLSEGLWIWGCCAILNCRTPWRGSGFCASRCWRWSRRITRWPASPRSAWRRWRASPSSFSTRTSALACMTTSSACCAATATRRRLPRRWGRQ